MGEDPVENNGVEIENPSCLPHRDSFRGVSLDRLGRDRDANTNCMLAHPLMRGFSSQYYGACLLFLLLNFNIFFFYFKML